MTKPLLGLSLRCYCCGRPLGSEFLLVAHQFQHGGESNDRVFVMSKECLGRLEAGDPTLKAQLVTRGEALK